MPSATWRTSDAITNEITLEFDTPEDSRKAALDLWEQYNDFPWFNICIERGSRILHVKMTRTRFNAILPGLRSLFKNVHRIDLATGNRILL